MIAAACPSTQSKTGFRFAPAYAVAAIISIGALLLLRGPETIEQPTLVSREFVLPNGVSLFVQEHEVSIAEWNLCADQNACDLRLRTRADQDPHTTPATGLSYLDALEYVAWMNTAKGRNFRLPTAQEWALIAAPVLPDKVDPIFTDPALTWASTYLTEGIAPRALKPQGSFSTSPAGIADLDGSVWEWTQDCATDTTDPSRCAAYYVGGEHVAAMSYLIRDPARGGCAVGSPPAHLGMRLVSDDAF